MAGADKKKLGALVVALVALLIAAGPSAGLPILSSGPSCTNFVGWAPLVNSLVCGFGGLFFTPPTPARRPPPPLPPPTATGSRQLSVGYYRNSNCSYDVEAAVRKAVEDAIKTQGRRIGASLIRLFFHDAFVRMTGPPNANSLRGFEVIDAAKEATTAACGGRSDVVSCADILAFAARDASFFLSYGEINYTVPAGRFDGRESFAAETNQLPGPDSDLQELVEMFAAKELDVFDLVALSGAHGVGRVRCLFTNGNSAMDPTYANDLRTECSGNPDKLVNQTDRCPGGDPDMMDNQYFKNIAKFVLFKSDATLISNATTRKQVNDNAANPDKWYKDFEAAMVKMGNIGVMTSPVAGLAEIRDVCWRVNGIY
nr:unnamed protein product [Digitaria exilis]